MGFGTGFGTFGIVSVLFCLVFLLALGIFVVIAIKGISQWSKNNKSPRLTVPATVVAKRTDVTSHGSHVGDHHHHHISTTYYVTFQVESGDYMELLVAGHEYGLLVEGATGRLTFQGTRYLGFERGMHTIKED